LDLEKCFYQPALAFRPTQAVRNLQSVTGDFLGLPLVSQ
jgi:hypothetical protein